MSRLLLVGCTGAKRTSAAAARDLYDTSQLFRARRRYADAAGQPWVVLSALHGIVGQERTLEPYDFTMVEHDATGLQAWASLVLEQVCRWQNGAGASFDGQLVLELHAGERYAQPLQAMLEQQRSGWRHLSLHRPLQGLGIGEQLGWYKMRSELLEAQQVTL